MIRTTEHNPNHGARTSELTVGGSATHLDSCETLRHRPTTAPHVRGTHPGLDSLSCLLGLGRASVKEPPLTRPKGVMPSSQLNPGPNRFDGPHGPTVDPSPGQRLDSATKLNEVSQRRPELLDLLEAHGVVVGVSHIVPNLLNRLELPF